MAVRDYCWESVIYGRHMYKTIWMPEISEILCCEQERNNPEDLYAVSVYSYIARPYAPVVYQLFWL